MLARIMGIETFAGILFLIWFAYMRGLAVAVWLAVGSFIVQLVLVRFESTFGLTKRAWIISLVGIPLVPALVSALVWLVLSPISN